MNPIRLGVIGAGLIWIRVHKPILNTMKDMFEPVAFCDSDEQRRAEVALEFPDTTVTNDYESLLAIPDVETVLVLTPIALNAPTARAVLAAGKDVIMEKPVARAVAEGQELLAAARQAGKRLVVTEQAAYRQAEDTLRELIASGAIGELVLWERVQHLEGDSSPGPLRYENTAWRKQADYPLGTLFDGGIHTIAGLTKTFGVPQAMVATGTQLRPEYGAYDHVAMTFQYANGTTGMLSYSSYMPPLHNHFHVYGTAGVIVIEDNSIRVETRDEPARTIDLPSEQSYVSMWHAIAQAYQEERAPFYTPEKALQDVAILEAVDQSIAAGERVQIARV